MTAGMDPVDAATVVRRPVRMLSGRFGRVISADQSAACFEIEVFDGNVSLGVQMVAFDKASRLRPGCDALIEIA